MLQCVSECCSGLQCGVVWCSAVYLLWIVVCVDVVQCGAVCCSMVQCVAVCFRVLQWVAVRCSVVQCGVSFVNSHYTLTRK